MKVFKDKEGTSWKIDLTIGNVMRVKSESEQRFNLFDPDSKVDGQSLLDAVSSNFPVLWELLAVIVSPQLADKTITAETFGELMAADCLIAARTAFFEEWRDFFQSLQQPDRAVALEKTTMYHAKAVDLIQAKLKAPEMAQVDERVVQRMESSLNGLFGELLDKLG